MVGKSLLLAEEDAAKEYAATSKVSRIALKDDLNDFHVLDNNGEIRATLRVESIDCPWKHLIFRALKAAYNQICIHEESSVRTKNTFFSFVQEFWTFVKVHPHFETESRVKIIKEFESFRIETRNIKPTSSGLNEIKNFINISLTLKGFNRSLSNVQREYLHRITEVKATTSYHDIKPINLNTWFTQHSWLRTVENGVGHAEYTSLGLPKRLMSSFSVTTVAALEQIQEAKSALIAFFKRADIRPRMLPKFKSEDDFGSTNLFNRHLKECFQQILRLILANKEKGSEVPHFDKAFELIFYSNLSDKYFSQCGGVYESVPPLTSIIVNHPTFHCKFLIQLVECSARDANQFSTTPVCRTEEIFFCWLMAVLSVQATNICGKRSLKLSDFKFAKKENGKITHISCLYFKTRAGKRHRTTTLSTDNYIGKVLVSFIKDVTGLVDYDIELVAKPYGNPVFAKSGDVAKSLHVYKVKSLYNELERQLNKYQASNIFYHAISTMLNKGVRRLDINRQKLNRDYIYTEVTNSFFGLSMVKTTAVYSRSASFNPTSLLNFNSHSNATERQHYLTENNMEWLNNCGRVTRTVFNDLLINVFRPSKKNLSKFNIDFTEAINFINNKKDESLALQIFVEESELTHRANEVGIITSAYIKDNHSLDNFYVEDSKWTVMKMLHYKQQVRVNHKKLWEESPTYLFSTVIPTLEWIEELLGGSYFSSERMKKGVELFAKFGKELPKVFTPHIG